MANFLGFIKGWVCGIAKGTPLWVWPLLAFLLYRGIKSLKPSVAQLHELFIMPLILVTISLQGLVKTYGLPLLPLSIWAALFVVGTLFMWLIMQNTKIDVDRKKGLLRLPGTALTLIIILSVFGVKYYLGYMEAISPGMKYELTTTFTRFALSGLMLGMLTGRLTSYLYRYHTADHTDLTQ